MLLLPFHYSSRYPISFHEQLRFYCPSSLGVHFHFSSPSFLSLYSPEETLILHLQPNGVEGRKIQNHTDWPPPSLLSFSSKKPLTLGDPTAFLQFHSSLTSLHNCFASLSLNLQHFFPSHWWFRFQFMVKMKQTGEYKVPPVTITSNPPMTLLCF